MTYNLIHNEDLGGGALLA